MKIFKLIILIGLCFQSMAFYDKWTLGVGTISEQIGQIQETIDGDKNGLDFVPFARLSTISEFILEHKLIAEIGSTLPRSSRDSDVTRMNYWLNFLMSKDLGFMRPQYGLGMYFTRISMDGTPQALSNGGVPTTFQTPNGSAVAGNFVVTLGTDIDFTQELFFNVQVMALNPEDNEERAFNIILSLNYDMGN
jgi:hypothetical protein